MYMCFRYIFTVWIQWSIRGALRSEFGLYRSTKKMSEGGREMKGELTWIPCRYWVFEIHILLSSIGLDIGMAYVDYVRDTGLMLYSFLKESKSLSFPLYCSTKFDTTLDIWEKQISSSHSDRFQSLTYSLTVGFQSRNHFFDRSFH